MPLQKWQQIEQCTKAGNLSNGDGWSHSQGYYGMTRMAALASIANAIGSAPALQARSWIVDNAPYTNLAGLQSTPQYWILPLTRW